MLLIIQTLLLLFQFFLAFLVGYLVLLTLSAMRAEKYTETTKTEPTLRFLFIIPAHNEEHLLPETLKSLSELDYSTSKFDVHVVADNCSDKTSSVAHSAGVVVHERYDPVRIGKGNALQWLLNQLWRSGVEHDAVCIIDADTTVSKNFLRVMDAQLELGHRVIQSYYAVSAPDRSWTSSLRYAALTVLHYLRPLGRSLLGGSVGLKGNGMVFAADVLKQHEWSESVTEDIELHMALLFAGERVGFAPDAVIWGEMPDTLADSATQHTRWEAGRMHMARRYIPTLLRESLAALKQGDYRRTYVLLDAVMEHVIPPFSVMTSAALLLLLASALIFVGLQLPITGSSFNDGNIHLLLARISLFTGTFIIVGEFIYLFSGLLLARAPKNVYLSLLYAPVLMIWKTVHYVRTMFGEKQKDWIRTARNEG